MFMEKGINLEPRDQNYDIKRLALECASKRMYPDIISSKINREITGSSIPVSPMGCRSFLGVWHDADGKEVLDGRNNLGVVSLNLPRIALDAGGDVTQFNKILQERLELCKEALITRIDQFKGVKASVAPVLYCEGAFGMRLDPNDDVTKAFENGRASISLGYIGLHETLVHLFGKAPHECVNIQNYGKGIITLLKQATEAWKKETGYGFSLYSTPAESLCHRFAKLDKAVYGEVKGVNEHTYYTNSFHQDVFAKTKPFDKIRYEMSYHRIASGGHISYVEYPDMKNNLDGLEAVWDFAMEHLAYFGTNTPVDQCFECKSHKEMTPTSEGFVCPVCGNKDPERMQVTRRTCGYLGSAGTVPWNAGKQTEMIHRYKHFSQI